MVHAYKGRTVMSEEERYSAIRHCRYVDEVLRNGPWEYTDDFLEKHKIDFVAHDDIPYESENTDDTYGELKKRGMFLKTERTEGVSTSDIVARIVRDYDVYVRRNLARGYSAKDLNVSYIKEKTYKFQNKMDELKDKGKKYIDTIGERTDDIIMKWEDKSREVVDNFLTYFFKTPMQIWKKSKGKFLKALTPPGTPSPGSEDEADFSPPKRVRRI